MENRKSFTAEDLAQCVAANHDAVSIPLSVLECMELVAENARLLQSALASQRDADKLLDKLHAVELGLAAIRGEPDALRKVDLI